MYLKKTSTKQTYNIFEQKSKKAYYTVTSRLPDPLHARPLRVTFGEGKAAQKSDHVRSQCVVKSSKH